MTSREAFRQFTLRGVQVTENELGHGSYAVVLELKYQGLKCAGKKLYQVLYESGIGHAARRYLEECQLLSQTRHPHIVQFIGVFFEEGSQFPILVMEFLPTNLSSCLDRYGILSDEISYSILHDVSLGLSYLHGQTPPIVHRDLSANNVLLSKDMTAKISDLGVARILNLTPLQVSRMTETPGTPAYMPPEVMVANPRYDTSVDVFSFGVMMIHTFTAEWPLPSVGPSRVDPNNPDRVIGVTEAERREEFLRKIPRDHPLMDLIMRCLSNNPQQRPRAEEIVDRMGDVVLQYPPSFENRVEMLQRISTLDTEKRELEQEIVRKDTAIEAKEGEVERLSEEKRRQEDESDSTIERIKMATSVEVDQKAFEIEHLKSQLESLEELRAQKKALTAEVEQQIVNVDFIHRQVGSLRTRENTLTEEVGSLTGQVKALTIHVEKEKMGKEAALTTMEKLSVQVEDLTGQVGAVTTQNGSLIGQVKALTTQVEEQRNALTVKDSIIASKNTVITSQEADMAAKESALLERIESLSGKLETTRDYLTTKPQPLQVQLAYNKCSEAPVKMAAGTAITINDKIYYGRGVCDSRDDDYSIHCYTPSQDKWSTLPKLSVCYFSMGKVNNELVTVGGFKQDYGRTNEVNVLVKGRSWKQTIPPMPTARRSPAVISLPTHLVVAGGFLPSGQPTDIVEIYNINTSQWNKTDRLPYAYENQRVAICNNKVYLVGGRDDKRLNKVVTAQVDQLIANSVPADQQEDGSTNKDSDHDSAWKKIANTPSYCPLPVAVSEMVLAIGGLEIADRKEYTPTQGVYAYSSSMDSWVYIGDLPSPRAYAATVLLSPTEFLVIGGFDENMERLNTVHKATITVSLK